MFEIKKPLKIEIITEYDCYEDIEDISDEDAIGGEYSGVSIKIDGELFLTYGNYYDDKGDEKAEAVIDTLEQLFGKKKLKIYRYDKVNRL